ncbi:tRNA epoxyqueuosine(34) reductase QueG [Patescibacteria group bacterium]|nr:tRNA epoxyqueuosine(34) reductase QueG [Patescibacteria group bacterium]
MDSDSLKTFIDSQGWSFFGIASFEKIKKNLKKHEKIFQKWIEKGFQADMDWLRRMKDDRFHPEHVLPEVKSVIVLGANYPNCGAVVERWWGDGSQSQSLHNEMAPQSLHNRGVVARYARGKDYHKVLKKKLAELTSFLNSQFPIPNLPAGRRGSRFYASVDSGPTVDRVLAEAAELGFFGRNTCLINPPRGSYFFIASLLTDLELPEMPQKPMPACGDCMKCQNACPTGALVASGQLDARKCISYLTIENKEGIPEDLRPRIGNRLFGCDACQEVCPFNAVSCSDVLIDPLKPENGAGESLDLKEILSIKSDEEFTERFAGTPLMRAKRCGLLRNACVVAGNSGEKTLIPFLEELIKREKDDIILDHARWAVNQLKSYGAEG